MRTRLVAALFGTLLVAAVGCSSSDEPGGPDVASSIDEGVDVSSSIEEGVDASSSIEEGVDVAPSGLVLVEGLPVIDVLGPPESGAGEVPQFRWEPIAGASRYDVGVLGPDGPLWAWQGEATEIYLGGLPFERPPGLAGPVIAAGSCWSVMARGADGHVIAVSEFLPISPAESTGHTCVPGSGPDTG